MNEAEESLPRLLSGRYRLDARLGKGGMGVVYRAVDMTMRRPVAIKLIRSVDGVELDDEVAGRFLREAKNTARVHHEHIVEIFDLGRSDDGELYFVMELLAGESLAHRLRRCGRLGPVEAVHIARQTCAALHVAHAASVIHRDLKPENIMLVQRAGTGDFVKVLDFGVSKAYGVDQDTLTHTGMLVGTVEYMAPEQIVGRGVDARTDVYALGIVLFKALSGTAPFADAGVPALIHAHLHLTPPSLVSLVPGVPPALGAVVERCLAKRPDDRFASMEELSGALAGALTNEPLSSAPIDVAGSDDGANADPYASSDETEVFERPPPEADAPEVFADATVRMERPAELAAVAGQRAATGSDAPPLRRPAASAEEVSTAKRPAVELSRLEAQTKVCAMCNTANAAHARACSACGVSLATKDQAAVRARVGPSDRPPPMPATAPQVGALPQVAPGPPMMPPAQAAHARSVPPPHGPPMHGAVPAPWPQVPPGVSPGARVPNVGPGEHFGARPSGGPPGEHFGARPSGGPPGEHFGARPSGGPPGGFVPQGPVPGWGTSPSPNAQFAPAHVAPPRVGPYPPPGQVGWSAPPPPPPPSGFFARVLAWLGLGGR